MPSVAADRAYFLLRAKAEQDLAAAATDPTVELIHQQLADEYEARADDEPDEKIARSQTARGRDLAKQQWLRFRRLISNS
jgi:hypothetical protein